MANPRYGLIISIDIFLLECHKDHHLDFILRVLLQKPPHGTESNRRRIVTGEAVHAGANGTECHCPTAILGSQLHGRGVAAAEKLTALRVFIVCVNGPDGMDDLLAGEFVSVRDLGVSRLAAAQRAAFSNQLEAGCAICARPILVHAL